MRAGNSSTHDTDRETDLDWGDRNDVGIIDKHRMNSGASVAASAEKLQNAEEAKARESENGSVFDSFEGPAAAVHFRISDLSVRDNEKR